MGLAQRRLLADRDRREPVVGGRPVAVLPAALLELRAGIGAPAAEKVGEGRCHGVLKLHNFYVGFLLPMMVEVQFYDLTPA